MDKDETENYMLYFNPETINYFNGTDEEKDALFSIFSEWNSSARVDDLCGQWVKVRLVSSLEHLSLLVWNCECLSTRELQNGHESRSRVTVTVTRSFANMVTSKTKYA
jgi:hypothetical protein